MTWYEYRCYQKFNDKQVLYISLDWLESSVERYYVASLKPGALLKQKMAGGCVQCYGIEPV